MRLQRVIFLSLKIGSLKDPSNKPIVAHCFASFGFASQLRFYVAKIIFETLQRSCKQRYVIKLCLQLSFCKQSLVTQRCSPYTVTEGARWCTYVQHLAPSVTVTVCKALHQCAVSDLVALHRHRRC